MLLTSPRRGSLPLGKMGERLMIHPTSVTNIVDRLETQGLVTRVRHPTDRRTTLCEITAAGRDRVKTATDAITAADFGIAGLGTRDVERLIELLAAFRHASGDFER